MVIEALGVGNLAIFENSVIPWIRKFSEAGKIVVIGSQSPFGRVDLQLYECGKMVKEAGGISSGDMTISAALVKLMFLLGKYPGDGEKIKREMELSLAGEITRQED